MIDIGIIGAADPAAGELIRILVNHPDVLIRTAYDTELVGHSVASVHHGLIGETDLKLTEKINPGELDAIVICKADAMASSIMESLDKYPELRVVDMTGCYRNRRDDFDMVYGLSEMNRKALVRGAKRAVVPSPTASAAIIALFPFALRLMLNSDISIKAAGVGASTDAAAEIAEVMGLVQNSFNSRVDVQTAQAPYRRGLRTSIRFKSTLSLADALDLYDSIYDDHNFTFVTTESLDIEEVEGTNKCLITVSKPDDDTMALDAIVDGTLRGGAGEAMHLINLLFGLHEKTGLALKAANYGASSI